MYKVIYVEDDDTSRFVLSRMLSGHYEIHMCSHPEQLFDCLRKYHYDLVLLDINLGHPDLNGFDLLRQIRSNPRYSHLKIMALSAYDDCEKYRSAGFDDFHIKPVNKLHLISQISSLL